jgi:transmembrane sensor
MDDLILRFLKGETTPEENELLRRWRDEEPANDRAYQEAERLWALLEAGDPIDPSSKPPDAGALIRRAERTQRSPRAERPRRWTVVLKAAALAALLIPAGMGIGWLLGGFSERPPVVMGTQIATGAGEMTTITLEDGTSIRLGPRSRLQLTQDGSEQVAYLDGRAFFGVQANPQRPFKVRTTHGEALVRGTRFEVRSEEDEFRVLVVEGSVQVLAGNVAADLSEGEMSRSHRGARPSRVKVDDVYSQLDWMGNALVFQATPLRRALQEVERRYGVDAHIERGELADITVTATFTDQDVREVVLILCEIVGARCSIDNGTARIGNEESVPPPPRP